MIRMGRIAVGMMALLVVGLPALVGAAGPAPGSPGSAETPYVVKKGDTLWDISRELMQDPLLWPNLWERNRFIADPNRIYPGDRLVLPGKDLAPAPVVESPKPTPVSPPERVEAPKPVPPPAAPAAAPQPAPAETRLAAPEPPIPPASRHAMVCSPTLVAEPGAERVGIGSLVRSIDNRGMLSMEDQVVLGLETNQIPKVGDRLTAARVGRSLMDPRTGQSAGRVLYAIGILEVTEVRDRVARARITYSCGPIALGDRVVPYMAVAFPEEKVARPTGRTVAGSVLDSLRGEQLMGLQQMAFVDVGASQGIGIGDVFALLRPNRPALSATGLTYPIPPDRLGDAVVVRVAERAATLLLTTSVREVRAGDRVVLSHQIAP